VNDLTAWLNNPTDYNQGCLLYNKYGSDLELKQYFTKGLTDSSRKKLFSELRNVYYALKNVNPLRTEPKVSVPDITKPAVPEPSIKIDPNILESMDNDWKRIYKQMSSTKARLSALVSTDADPRENDLNLVKIRRELAYKVMELYGQMMDAISIMEHYKSHGEIIELNKMYVRQHPDLPTDPLEIKRQLDNERKGLNKLKRKPVNTERTILMNYKQERINRLTHAIEEYKRSRN